MTILGPRRDAKRTVVDPQRVRHALLPHPSIEWGQECVEQVARDAASEHGRREGEVLSPPSEPHHALRASQPAIIAIAPELDVSRPVRPDPLRPTVHAPLILRYDVRFADVQCKNHGSGLEQVAGRRQGLH
eukprot:2659552-Rhodomonas_salina.1